MGSAETAAANAAKTAKMEDGFPKAFGPYMLLSAFAQGGMGEVYLAKSGGIEGIDRLCVLKKLRADVSATDEFMRRFVDEARIVVQLSHPNISHVFDVGRVGHEHYLAMEYVSGVNLREVQRRAYDLGRVFPQESSVWVLSQMLEALDYAHRHRHPMTGKPLNVVHRDISPQNVMVSFEGDVKLIDFGLAASEMKEEQTESQVVMGKVAYMSPEQARGDDVTPATDQFATAVSLYELLAGDRYYGNKSNYDIWQVVGRGGYVPERWSLLNDELARILGRALAPAASDRYPSCGDFKDDLDRWLIDNHPGTNKRSVRRVLEQFFEGAELKERAFLARFADVSGASARGGGEVVRLAGTGSDKANAAPSGDAALEPPSDDITPRGEPTVVLPGREGRRDARVLADDTSALVSEVKRASRATMAAVLGGLTVLVAVAAWLLLRSEPAAAPDPAPPPAEVKPDPPPPVPASDAPPPGTVPAAPDNAPPPDTAPPAAGDAPATPAPAATDPPTPASATAVPTTPDDGSDAVAPPPARKPPNKTRPVRGPRSKTVSLRSMPSDRVRKLLLKCSAVGAAEIAEGLVAQGSAPLPSALVHTVAAKLRACGYDVK